VRWSRLMPDFFVLTLGRTVCCLPGPAKSEWRNTETASSLFSESLSVFVHFYSKDLNQAMYFRVLLYCPKKILTQARCKNRDVIYNGPSVSPTANQDVAFSSHQLVPRQRSLFLLLLHFILLPCSSLRTACFHNE
jgi:hypothetical protein